MKAPRAWPNSSASAMPSGIAAQLIATNGPDARGEKACSAAAISSLPEPVSPWIETGTPARARRRVSA